MQFLFALAGCTAGQRGPIWWASHHRHHHLCSDQPEDPHSPNRGLLESHMLWFLKKGNFATRTDKVNDLMRFRELRIVEALHWLPFAGLAITCYYSGVLLDSVYPALGTSGPQMLVWGFFISTILLYHGTYTINSLAHRFGSRRFETADDSRNNPLLAVLTLGEGWHNNHHRYPASTRQGFFWWEIDISYMILRLMAMAGLVQDMRPVPVAILREARGKSA
jgi:stearoyl-CoA desaturase (delta-9 desaturase)